MLNSPWIRKPDFRNLPRMTYEDYWEHRGWKINNSLKSREEIILDLIKTDESIIDIGCGNSLLPVKLREKGARVAVGDVSKTVLQEYKKLGISTYEVNLEEVQPLPFIETFDWMILSEVLEHTRNPEEVIQALKPKARQFLITVPNSAAYIFRYGLMFKGRFFTQWVHHPSEHLRYWSHTDFLDWLSAMGFKVEKSIPSDGFTCRGLMPFLPGLWKNFFGYRMIYVCRPLLPASV